MEEICESGAFLAGPPSPGKVHDAPATVAMTLFGPTCPDRLKGANNSPASAVHLNCTVFLRTYSPSPESRPIVHKVRGAGGFALFAHPIQRVYYVCRRLGGQAARMACANCSTGCVLRISPASSQARLAMVTP